MSPEKPVRHDTQGWNKVGALACAAFAVYDFVAAANHSGAKSFAFDLAGAIAVLGAIHCGRSLVRAAGHRLAAMLPAAPVRAIDQLYAEIGQRIARGEKLKFVYNEQSRRA